VCGTGVAAQRDGDDAGVVQRVEVLVTWALSMLKVGYVYVGSEHFVTFR
jgi:hypothetical protein